jgi:fused-like protein
VNELESFVVKDMYHSNGLEFIMLNGGLSLHPIENHESILADNLLVLTQICKQSKEYYPGIQMVCIGPDLLALLKGPSKFLKVKVCNLIGQMCKHSDFFYEELKEADIFPEMIKLCCDQDKVVKKASSFAIGNAAYYSSSLYRTLEPAIEKIVVLLQDPDERIKTNSIGTISNLTRNSDCLVPEMMEHRIPEIFVDLLLFDKSLIVKKLVIHAFRNFFKHPQILKSVKKTFDERRKRAFKDLMTRRETADLHRHLNAIKKHLGLK